MKTEIHSFLGDQTNSELINFRQQLSRTAKEVEEYFTAASESNLLISSQDADEWMTNLPLILNHQITTIKLSSRQVYGLERTHFEEKLEISEHVQKYVNRFGNIDITANDYCYQILNCLSVSMQQAVVEGGRYHEMQELLNDLSLRMIVASILFEIHGYNTFNGLYYETDILDLMAELDTPINLIHEESIIPVRVFSDFVEIEENVRLIFNICQMKIGNMVDPYFAAFSDDLDRDRNTFEEKLQSYVEKYPCLQGKRLSRLGNHLLDHYTLQPVDVIGMFGQNIICCPFRIPENFKLTESEKIWRAPTCQSDYDQVKILF